MKKIFLGLIALTFFACSNSGDSKPVTDTSTSINQSTGGNAVPDTTLTRPDSSVRR